MPSASFPSSLGVSVPTPLLCPPFPGTAGCGWGRGRVCLPILKAGDEDASAHSWYLICPLMSPLVLSGFCF